MINIPLLKKLIKGHQPDSNNSDFIRLFKDRIIKIQVLIDLMIPLNGQFFKRLCQQLNKYLMMKHCSVAVKDNV